MLQCGNNGIYGNWVNHISSKEKHGLVLVVWQAVLVHESLIFSFAVVNTKIP